eukprot:3094633-Prorocentrum_lima.AAC.1
MTSSLVGSEMCIRDRLELATDSTRQFSRSQASLIANDAGGQALDDMYSCLLYTSDAADDM